jgi:FixJ family two-component response regulator
MHGSGPLIYVVDDEDKVRELVARVVRSYGYETEAYGSAAEFLMSVRTDRPTCLLLDVHLVDGTGFELFAELERRRIEMPTIFITGDGTIPMSVEAMKAGAVEFLTKPVNWEALSASLKQAVARAELVAARRAERLDLQARHDRLTPREAVVFPYVARGWPNKQIAAELDIVEQTVKVHRARIMQKLEVESVVDLARLHDRITELGVETKTG